MQMIAKKLWRNLYLQYHEMQRAGISGRAEGQIHIQHGSSTSQPTFVQRGFSHFGWANVEERE